jgi:hypothetical protein
MQVGGPADYNPPSWELPVNPARPGENELKPVPTDDRSNKEIFNDPNLSPIEKFEILHLRAMSNPEDLELRQMLEDLGSSLPPPGESPISLKPINVPPRPIDLF